MSQYDDAQDFPVIEDQMIDRDLARPEFASWAAMREAKQLLDIAAHLWWGTDIHRKAKKMYYLACELDEEIGSR